MATLTLSAIRSNIRSELNETTTTVITDTELNTLVNDGFKDTTIKGLCLENKITKDNIPMGKIVSMLSDNPIRINYAEYKTGATEGGLGMLCCLPQTIGHSPINDNSPRYWFSWGRYLVIEPIAAVATYDLAIYAAGYPTTVASGSLVVGTSYIIESVGTTTWATAGASAETRGTEFTATATSSGTGTAITFSQIPPEFHECIYLFALAFAALKLKRWADAANIYNQYIVSVQQKRAEYVMKYIDARSSHTLPDIVQMEEARRG